MVAGTDPSRLRQACAMNVIREEEVGVPISVAMVSICRRGLRRGAIKRLKKWSFIPGGGSRFLNTKNKRAKRGHKGRGEDSTNEVPVMARVVPVAGPVLCTGHLCRMEAVVPANKPPAANLYPRHVQKIRACFRER